MKIFKPFIAICLLLLFSPLAAQETIDYDSLNRYIEKAVSDFGVPGFAVGIVEDGELVFTGTYGKLHADQKKKVNENSVFGIASCSKAFTAACIAILVDEGALKWDDRVVDHYPEFSLYDPYITREMRVRDLVSHRAGYQTFDGDLLWYATNYSREEVVERFTARDNKYSFRSHFGYSNLMFIEAGQLIEKVSGMSWDTFIQKKIFAPIGMENSNTTTNGFDNRKNTAYPHVDGKALPFLNYDNSGPAASINASVSDLSKWVQLMLDKGAYADTNIFSEAQYYEMVSPQTLLNAGKAETIDGTHFYAYGLGWFLYDYQGRKMVQHGGGLPGFHSKVFLIPEDQSGFIILSNQLSALVPAMERQIRDVLLGVEGKDWAAIMLKNEERGKTRTEEKKKEKEASRITDTKASLALDQYVGTYKDEMYGEAAVWLIDGQLSFSLLPAQELFTSELKHWHYDSFQFQFKDPFLPEGWVTFVLDNKGAVDYFTIDLPNPDFHFFKLKFEKQ